MRKLLMLVTMLLVPALANAWTFAVKVTNTTAGIAAGNKATVTIGAASTDVTANLKYFTPSGSVTVAVANAPSATISLVGGTLGAPVVAGTTNTYTIPANATKTLQTLNVVYATAATSQKCNLSVVQTPGGMTQLQVGGSSTVKGFTGVPVGTPVAVKVNPSTGYSLTSVSLNGAPLVAPYTFNVADTTADVVTAIYTKDAVVTATLALAQSGPVPTPVTATVTATGATGYAWTVNGVAQASVTNAMTFTPVNGANMVQVTIAGAAVPVVKSATFMGYDATATANYTCTSCHSGSTPAVLTAVAAGTHLNNGAIKTCATCHVGGTGTVHNPGATCIGCHSVGQNAGAGFVQDNAGVRAVVGEFSKWSHHVTGVNLQDAHCAACHLEGKIVSGEVVVDTTYHMADAKTHLRNADTDADLQWDPAAPSHSTMDTFCLSCHDSNGATSTASAAIQAVIIPATGKTASASNPFGDTISNQYDMLERPAVVDAASQFATTNASHHAVLGKKYTGRTRVAGSRQIANAAAFTSNSSAAMPGKRSTIFDAGKFQNDYTTLADAAGETDVAASLNGRNGGTSLGDDSTLHCGDCHTVGQFRAADAAPGNRYNKQVIGAHGSNNEYLLRNNVGTDALHQGAETEIAGGNYGVGYGTKPYLVCFNCHAFATYGTVGANNGENGKNHAGDYSKDERCNGPFNTVFGNMTGEHRLRSMSTVTGLPTDATYPAATYGKWVGGGKYFGNMFGIQCANCHNSGVKENIYGGIHGSKVQTYVDGMGNQTRHYRFMPGLGNAMYVPGVKGGFTGGTNATYKAYSGNRNGTQSGTGTNFGTIGQSFSLLPVRTIRIAGVDNANGSYTYVTGGISKDLNWEQRTQQSIAGQTDLQSKAVGCYTITPDAANYTWSASGTAGPPATYTTTQGSAPTGQQKNPKVLALQAGGYPADDIRNAASTGLTAGDGREVFDVWGGCDDHNGAPGAGTGMVRKVLRKVSY